MTIVDKTDNGKKFGYIDKLMNFTPAESQQFNLAYHLLKLSKPIKWLDSLYIWRNNKPPDPAKKSEGYKLLQEVVSQNNLNDY